MRAKALPGMRSRRPALLARPGRVIAWMALLAAATVPMIPAGAWAALPPTLCVVQQDPVPGLEAEALRVAVALEKRRVGAAFNRVDAPSLDDCPVGSRTVVVVVGAGDAWWQGADGAPRSMETSTMDPRDRATEVARRVVAVLAAPAGAGDATIVEGDLPAAPARPAVAAPAKAVGAAADRDGQVQGYVRVGGRYEYQPGIRLNAGAIEVETGVSLLDERLAVGLRGGWQPEGSVRGDGVDAHVTAGPVALMVRGGLRWPAVRVRIGLGAGLEWRRVELRSSTSSRRPVDARVFPTLEAEVEVAVPFGGVFRLAIAGGVRGFPTWTEYAWAGRTVLTGPKVGVGVALRLEAVFGEETR